MSPSDTVRLELLGRRLSGELTALIDAIPAEHRTARGLARFLHIDRGTAQRVLVGARLIHEPIMTLIKGPGVAGLRQIAHGAVDADISDESVRGLAAAADLFDAALRDLGTSQSGLARLHEQADHDPSSHAGGDLTPRPATSAAYGGADSLDSRRRLFESAAEALGRVMDTRVILMICRPKPGDPTRIEVFGGHGVIGYRARADAMPMVLGKSVDPLPEDPSLPETPPAGNAARADFPTPRTPTLLSGEHVLMEYCTQPLALVTSKRRGREVHAVIEPRGANESADVVLASNEPDDDENAQHFGRIHETRFNVRVPARSAVFDVYLDRSLAQNCVPSLDLYLWPREPRSLRPSNWYDAIPGVPLLQVLGPGLRNAASASYARQGELAASLFGLCAWNADQFVGYRCETAYPFWAGCYTMGFDYRATVDDATA
jgi:hypothetical protein